MKRYILLFFLLFISLSSRLDAYNLDVKRFAMPNGLKVLLVERHNLPIVTVSLLIKASPFDEPIEKAGVANLTAELLTEGTRNRKAKDISEEIEFIGASLDTSVESDFTMINLSVLKKDIQKGFDIFSDILLNPSFPEEEITRKKEILIGGLKQSEEDPSFVADRAFRKAIYGDHPYGRLVTGSEDTIAKITRDDIVAFHDNYYSPDDSILAVVGDITVEEAKELIGRYLGKWVKMKVSKKKTTFEVEKKRDYILIDKDLTQANIIMGHSGIRRGDPDYYAVTVMNYILGGGGFSSRLMQVIRDDMGLAYDINSLFDSREKGGFFRVSVQTKNEAANTVINEIIKQIKKLKTEGVTDQEIADAKAYLTGSFPRRFDTNKKIANILVAIEFYDLGPDYIERYPEYIRSVSKDDIIRVARKYLDTDNYILVVVAKQSKANIDINSTGK